MALETYRFHSCQDTYDETDAQNEEGLGINKRSVLLRHGQINTGFSRTVWLWVKTALDSIPDCMWENSWCCDSVHCPDSRLGHDSEGKCYTFLAELYSFRLVDNFLLYLSRIRWTIKLLQTPWSCLTVHVKSIAVELKIKIIKQNIFAPRKIKAS